MTRDDADREAAELVGRLAHDLDGEVGQGNSSRVSSAMVQSAGVAAMSSRWRCRRSYIAVHSGPGRPLPTGSPSTAGHRQHAAAGGGDPDLVAVRELAGLDVADLGSAASRRRARARRRATCRAGCGGRSAASPACRRCTGTRVLDEPSSSSPSRTSSASSAPRSAASWRSSTLPSSAIDLMSQRSQRMSCSVTARSPLLERRAARARDTGSRTRTPSARRPAETGGCGRAPRRASPAGRAASRRRRPLRRACSRIVSPLPLRRAGLARRMAAQAVVEPLQVLRAGGTARPRCTGTTS